MVGCGILPARTPLLERTRRAFHQPQHVLVVRRGNVERDLLSLLQDGNRPGVHPFLDLGMAVRKGEAAGAVMVAGRVVHDLPLGRFVGIAGHADDHFAVIDGVLTLIHEHPGHGGIAEVGELFVDPKPRAEAGDVRRVNPSVHGHAAHARELHSLDGDRAQVRGTLEQFRRLAAVAPQEALGQVFIDVPVAGIAGIKIEGAMDPFIRSI